VAYHLFHIEKVKCKYQIILLIILNIKKSIVSRYISLYNKERVHTEIQINIRHINMYDGGMKDD
jgi:hypothetical protein